MSFFFQVWENTPRLKGGFMMERMDVSCKEFSARVTSMLGITISTPLQSLYSPFNIKKQMKALVLIM
jgi:hypothetical protein